MTTHAYLTTRAGVYAWTGPFETKDMVKAAGFRWHAPATDPWCAKGRCKACKAGLGKGWWTDDQGKASRLIDYADAPTRAALTQHTEAVQASRATDAVVDAPAPAGFAYMPFQRAGIAYGMSHPNVLFGDEPGLGKTVEALGIVNADPTIQRVLVICPASLRINWAREAQRWLVRPFEIYIAETNDAPPPSATLVITNYERASKSDTALATALANTRWDAMVVDEAHMLKSQTAKRTQVILGIPSRRKGEPEVPGLIHRARRKLLLTGTPIVNRPVEFFPLLHALAPADFPNFFGYAKRYCDAKQVGIGRGETAWDFSGASHLDELQNKVRSLCMIRRLKKDVLTELPAKIRQVVVLPRDDRAERAVAEETARYAPHAETLASLQDEVDAAHAMGDEEAYKAAVEKLQAAYRVAFSEMSAARHALALAKAPAVAEHVQAMLDGGVSKVVVWGHHKDVIASITADLADYGAVSLTGDDAMDVRQAAVDRFQTDPSCRVFVGSIQAAGVGLTLTASSNAVFAELDWVPGNVSQAEDRQHRIGQHDSVYVQHLVYDGSLDSHLAKTLVAKQAVLDKALDEVPEPIRPLAPKANGADQREARPRTYPVPSTEQRAAAHHAMRFLAARCDGARTEDGAGFNKIDTGLGHRLAALPSLSDGQTWLATKLARKYRRQLPETIRATLALDS